MPHPAGVLYADKVELYLDTLSEAIAAFVNGYKVHLAAAGSTSITSWLPEHLQGCVMLGTVAGLAEEAEEGLAGLQRQVEQSQAGAQVLGQGLQTSWQGQLRTAAAVVDERMRQRHEQRMAILGEVQANLAELREQNAQLMALLALLGKAPPAGDMQPVRTLLFSMLSTRQARCDGAVLASLVARAL